MFYYYPLLGLSCCLLFPCWLFLLLTISVLWVYCVAVPCSWCPCCCSTLYKFITNPYKHTHELINVCYLLVVLLDVLTSNILLKYKRIIQNENRKRIFTKKKKRKILINSAISTTLENYCLRERN